MLNFVLMRSAFCRGVVANEQPAGSNLETDVPPPSPVADPAISSPQNLSEPVPVRRYPVRVRKPPARLDL